MHRRSEGAHPESDGDQATEGKMQIRLGESADCTDGTAGAVVGFTVDRSMRTMLAVAVEPPQRPGGARLVPVRLVERAGRDGIRLGIDLAGYYGLERFRFIRFMHDDPIAGDAGPRQDPAPASPNRRLATFVSRAPEGQMLVRRDTAVLAGRRAVGSLAGADADALGLMRSLSVLALDLRREVAIPMAVIDGAGEAAVRTLLSPREFAKLPETDVGPRRRAA
jgi:hypothetical protein